MKPLSLAALLLLAPSLAAQFNPNPSPARVRWTYTGAGMGPVAVGARSAHAWFSFQNAAKVALVPTTEVNLSSPTPVTTFTPLLSVVDLDAARTSTEACVHGWDATTQSASYELFDARKTTATWGWTLPGVFAGEMYLADTGWRYTGGYATPFGASTVSYSLAFNISSPGTSTFFTSSVGAYPGHSFSGDGRRMSSKATVWDVDTGLSVFSGSPIEALGTTASTIAGTNSGTGVHAWVLSGTTYNKVLNYNDGAIASDVYDLVAVSGSGKTVVAAGHDGANPSTFTLYVFNVNPTSGALIWNYYGLGSGSSASTPNKAHALSISEDGRWIGVATEGAPTGGQDEFLLFDRDAGNVPIYSQPTSSAVLDCDVGFSGQFAVFSTNQRVTCYDRGGQGLWLEGVLSPGQQVRLNAGGSPGERVLLGVSTSFTGGAPIPGYGGTFKLGPSLFPPLDLGAVPAGGVIQVPITLPAVSLVGQVLYLQSLRLGGLSFDNLLHLTFLP